MIFNMSGGGAALNFVVIPNPKPETAKENTIWVDTDSITSWVFSATAPDNPKAGMVWFSVAASSGVEFNALRKNGIHIYPVSAKQYIGGEWVNKTAKSYQNDAWVEWLPEGALYWHGNECVAVTGGWTSKAWKLQSDAGTTAQTYQITRNPDNLTFTKTGQIGAVMHTAQAINLTNAKAIRFKGEMSKASKTTWVAFHVWSSISGNYWATNSKATVATDTTAGKKEFTLDVSALTGNFYLGFGIYDANCSVKVEELVLEV